VTTVQQALAIGPSSSARDRTVDITTTGAKSGLPRRIETWFYRVDDRIYLSGRPAPRGWAANLLADPRLTFHLKHGIVADLPATARRIDDDGERRRILGRIVDDLGHGRRRMSPEEREAWMVGSPLFEVAFDDPQLP
jgi:hypothetical protein